MADPLLNWSSSILLPCSSREVSPANRTTRTNAVFVPDMPRSSRDQRHHYFPSMDASPTFSFMSDHNANSLMMHGTGKESGVGHSPVQGTKAHTSTYSSMSSAEILDMYCQQKVNYTSIAMANPFQNPHVSVDKWISRQDMGRMIPIPPVPELAGLALKHHTGQPHQIEGSFPEHGQYDAVYTSPMPQPPPSASDSGVYLSSYTESTADDDTHLKTNIQAERIFEGFFLAQGTLRFDRKAQKKVLRKIVTQEAKAEKWSSSKKRGQLAKAARICALTPKFHWGDKMACFVRYHCRR